MGTLVINRPLWQGDTFIIGPHSARVLEARPGLGFTHSVSFEGKSSPFQSEQSAVECAEKWVREKVRKQYEEARELFMLAFPGKAPVVLCT